MVLICNVVKVQFAATQGEWGVVISDFETNYCFVLGPSMFTWLHDVVEVDTLGCVKS